MTISNINKAGKNVASNVASMLKSGSLNFTQLSGFTGVSRSTLARIDQAKKNRTAYQPMLKTAIRLADLAGISVDEFISTRLTFQ